MPEYQRKTEIGDRVRGWGGLVALGGAAVAIVSLFGMFGTSNREYKACDTPKPAETCHAVQGDEALWLQFLITGAAVAIVGGAAYGGADELDRRLVVHRQAVEMKPLIDADLVPPLDKAYMNTIPAAPPNPDDSRNWRA